MVNNYTPEQEVALEKIRGIVGRLIEIEEFQTKAHQPQLGLQGYSDTSDADLCLENYPPSYALENELRKKIVAARNLGLENDPLVRICEELSRV